MIEIIKTIALVCQITAGDNPSFNNMAEIIEKKQRNCHYYYSKCLGKNKFMKCLINRKEEYDVAIEKLRKGQ